MVAAKPPNRALADRSNDPRTRMGDTRKYANGDQPLPRINNGAWLFGRFNPQLGRRWWLDDPWVSYRRTPAVEGTAAIIIMFELFTLYMIRDNLTLNILMLVYPLDAIKLWQGSL